ncbi:MAG TPA: hypothetical protein VEW74_02160 [Candidatus Nitrosotalea sp.]|nr:hypothetical protein [Candidatus Nitrosotalea sp.]
MQYETSGQDFYRIVPTGASSQVAYAGSQRLSIRREGSAWRFESRAQYTRTGPDGKSRGQADFVQTLEPDGAFEDRVEDDPDFLTILNQPFAVHLDATTLRDLRTLHGRVPFAATSPLGAQAVLHGFLRPAPGGPIAGHPTVAVRFEADGAMTGPSPGSAQTLVSGTMRMDGVAYYAIESATLFALNVTLTLDARLAQGRQAPSVPVRIFYRRSIRAVATSAKTPPRAPLAAGAGTVAPATP